MGEFIFYATALIFCIILLYLLTWFWPPDSPWSFWWKTDKSVSRKIIRLAAITKKDIVYELGSGDGEFMLVLGDEVGAKGIGIEIDPYRHYLSQIRLLFHPKAKRKITFVKKNFFDISFSDATVVYLYLVPRAIEKILPKLKKELKKGTKVVSYRYPMNLTLRDENKKTLLYLYQI